MEIRRIVTVINDISGPTSKNFFNIRISNNRQSPIFMIVQDIFMNMKNYKQYYLIIYRNLICNFLSSLETFNFNQRVFRKY